MKKVSEICWVSSYHNDDPFGRYQRAPFRRFFKKSLKYFQSHHVYCEKNIKEYEGKGLNKVKFLMAYYCPWLSCPVSGKPTKTYQVVFVGDGENGSRVRYL